MLLIVNAALDASLSKVKFSKNAPSILLSFILKNTTPSNNKLEAG